jgi:2'-5' RNA ligase
LPADTAAEVASIVEVVRSMPLPAGARDVRWVRLDGLHLTLRFLGPTPDALVAPTVSAVEMAAATAAGPFELELAGAGTFPPGRRPRALWIGIAGGTTTLADLAARTEEALVGAGWQPEHRPFRAHLTLARSDGVASGQLVADRLADAMADRRIRCTIHEVGVFESITGGGPARYVPIARYGLRPSAESE